jgi:hypothetical protein
MTGMKEGAGEDPFASDTSSSGSETDEPEAQAETETSATPAMESGEQQSGQQRSLQIPYKYRRDGVQDGRERVPLFLKPDTKSAERDALRELEDRFDENVSLTDLREGLMKAGLEHLDEVGEQLEEWGYGMTFDE